MKIKSIFLFCFGLYFLPAVALASLVFIPSKFIAKNAKVLVVIHGCLQSAESMALGTGWDQIAELNNLVVIYPQVPEGSNPLSCWNWYLPENQRNDSGQLKILLDDIKSIKRRFKLINSPTFITGISSGAATTAGLLACFPKEFKAGAIHSGPSYGLAQTLAEGERILKEGPSSMTTKNPCQPLDFNGSILVIQGSTDAVVHPSNGKRIISDFVGNTEIMNSKKDSAGGLNYSISDYVSKKSGKGKLIIIEGLGHAWSGFASNLKHGNLLGPKSKIPTNIPFFSDEGPSSTNLIWDFFQEVAQVATDNSRQEKQRRKKL